MRDRRRNDEAGIALVLALLSLMLLTFLGLALAATTSTELQIANNYRWSQQAFYNAEAGIEIAKKVLGTADWATALPTLRTTPWYGYSGSPGDGTTLTPPTGGADRDYESSACDWRGNGMGYGRVLNDGAIVYANVSTIGTGVSSRDLRGAFTIWVRRPLQMVMTGSDAQGTWVDRPDNTNIVITAEGVAPYRGGAAGIALAQQYQAVRTIEATVTSTPSTTVCETPGGQTGGSEGSNFGKCFALDPASLCDVLGNCTGGAAPAQSTDR